jgi:hypothetical protein
MQVVFTQHGAERMQQRLNISIKAGSKVDITAGFAHSRTYLCSVHGKMMESWYCTIPGVRAVMIVNRDTKEMVTLMTQGHVVDTVYAQARNTMH